jgi:serine/threonine protein kinase
VLRPLQGLAARNIVHYDLKCDNVLLDPLPGSAADANFWAPGAAAPPFRVVLADFGESRMYSCAQAALTTR